MLAPLTFCEQSKASVAMGKMVLNVVEAVEMVACASEHSQMLRAKVSSMEPLRPAMLLEPVGKARGNRNGGWANTYIRTYMVALYAKAMLRSALDLASSSDVKGRPHMLCIKHFQTARKSQDPRPKASVFCPCVSAFETEHQTGIGCSA